MDKKNFIIVLIIVVVLAGLWWFLSGYQSGGEVLITTEKPEYIYGEDPTIIIENNLSDKVCFSSCYPYYLERKEGQEFKVYQYTDCPEADLVEVCIEVGGVKRFKMLLDKLVDKGLHRVAVPVCVGCAFQEVFKGDESFYSNEFEIK